MGDSRNIREIIERIVSVSLNTHVTALKDELVDKACEQLENMAPAQSQPATPPGGAPTDLLNAAVNSVLDSVSQTDILTSLLEGSTKFAERAALFVVRGGNAIGWRSTGLEPHEDIKSFTIDLNDGLASRAYHDRAPASASATEFNPAFVSKYGAPANGSNAIVLPLVLRDKVAALVYADAGVEPGGRLDPSALECLVHCSGLWLEIVAARKAGTPLAETAPDTEKITKYSEPATDHEQPAAQHAEPEPTAPPPAAAPEPAFAAESMAAASATAPAPETVSAMAAAAAPSPLAGPSDWSPEEEEIHKKAKRFAKLLVDEIKLYNQAKVAEGRSHKNLYERLKDDIDKSRATYDRRYGSTCAAGGNYFIRELIRILANDDPSLLGEGFSG